MMRVLVPVRLRKAVRGWFDSRYISVADHRQDIKDALWEVQTLRREVVTLQEEVRQLASRTGDAQRLSKETADALDHVLQNEVLVWQAIDGLKERS
ncbi:hypothetical protein ACIBKY_33630 [Nonomuraea sp. NPDC050394]|uniref:hypothetical protein n=1 Tax=Nonomuraea sp. NPDC050394 TaxID=3364363 RepID=UPI0037BB41BE